MSQTAAFPHFAGRRYSWCPSCDELWVREWMVAEGVRRCPVCDGRVLAYVGRCAYEMPRGHADGRRGPPTASRTLDRPISALASVP
jgi:hypothetical protein